MKIIVKTINGKQLPLEIEPDWTVRQIKEQIEKDHAMKADSLRIIAYGKVLDQDNKTASECALKEGDFVVAMVQKPKPAPKAGGKPEDVKMEDEPVAQPQPAATQSQAQAQPVAQAQPQPPVQQPAAAQQNLPPEVESAVQELMAISGKSRELCIQALIAAHNIPDIAFEFLMSGMIPPVGGQNDGAGADGDEPYEDEGEGEEGDVDLGQVLGQYNLDQNTLLAIQGLVQDENFPLVRQRMIEDPNFAQQFMTRLQQSNPTLFAALQQNPGLLMTLILGHDPLVGMMGGQQHHGAGHAGGHGGGHHGGGMHQQHPQPGQLQVSPAEMEAINRLASLGFPKARAAEAYFACDKNEEFAANFLFEAGAEDEDIAT